VLNVPGKLPIDLIRAADDAPGIYADYKQLFAQQQATHCGPGNLSANDGAASRTTATQEDA